MLEDVLQYFGISLIITAVVNTIIQLCVSLCTESDGSGITVRTVVCGVPSSLLFLTSGILCLTGPILGTLICNMLTVVFHMMLIVCVLVFLENDEFKHYNWIFKIVGTVLSISASTCSILLIYS